MDSNTGKYIMLAGAVVLMIGIFVYFFHDKLNWLGRLPGDIRIEKENFRFYFPIVTMVLLSVVLSGIVWVVKKLI
ncbi:MAG TPA: DUF2905 domain-containing protein [Chitinophagaceae bacterium]